MAQLYGQREYGKGKIVVTKIICDKPGCGATIKSHPEIASSGWAKTSLEVAPDLFSASYDWCPTHATGANNLIAQRQSLIGNLADVMSDLDPLGPEYRELQYQQSKLYREIDFLWAGRVSAPASDPG